MGDSVNLRLPNGVVSTFSVPLPDAIAKQVAAGKLKPVESATTPDGGLDGDGGAERVSAPPTLVPDAETDPSSVPPPAGNASQAEWAAYAVTQGMDPDEAATLKREEIKARIVPEDDTVEGE